MATQTLPPPVRVGALDAPGHLLANKAAPARKHAVSSLAMNSSAIESLRAVTGVLLGASGAIDRAETGVQPARAWVVLSPVGLQTFRAPHFLAQPSR